MNIDSLLEIVFAWLADPSFVGMTKASGWQRTSGWQKRRFCHAEERSIWAAGAKRS